MNKIFLFLLTVTFFDHSFSQAKGRDEEPERRPVQRLVCIEPTPENLNSYSYLSASLYESLFYKNSVRVTENRCYRTNYLSCQGQEVNGNWNIYKTSDGYSLVNLNTQKTYKVNCREVNGSVP